MSPRLREVCHTLECLCGDCTTRVKRDFNVTRFSIKPDNQGELDAMLNQALRVDGVRFGYITHKGCITLEVA